MTIEHGMILVTGQHLTAQTDEFASVEAAVERYRQVLADANGLVTWNSITEVNVIAVQHIVGFFARPASSGATTAYPGGLS